MGYNAGASSGNLILIQKQVASNSASLTFTTGITGYEVLFLEFYGVLNVDNNQNLYMQVSTDGGSTYLSTNYISQGAFSYSGGLVQNPASANLAAFMLSQSPENSSTTPACGSAKLFNFKDSAFNKYCFSNYVSYYGATPVASFVGTSLESTAVVNAVRIIAQSGNISVGTFKLYGVQN